MHTSEFIYTVVALPLETPPRINRERAKSRISALECLSQQAALTLIYNSLTMEIYFYRNNFFREYWRARQHFQSLLLSETHEYQL